MKIYKSKVDLSIYEEGINQREAYYGLPEDVKYCKLCVISNQRPNSAVEFSHTRNSKKETINFDENEVCDACNQSKVKAAIDWNAREDELKELCDKFRSTGAQYDCLIPGSGGKDSFYQAHILKYKYGMNPLTITWAPNLYTDWGRRNHKKWIDAGFDNYLVTPNGQVTQLLTRLSVENIFHPFQPFMIGQKAAAPKFAAKFDIPLIFYGENEAEYGNPVADNTSAKREWKYFSSEDTEKVFLGGASIKELTEDYGLSKNDLSIFMPVDPSEMEKKEIEVHYLGYYLKWHPQFAYYYSVEHGEFEAAPERSAGTYSRYSSIDDKIDDFHYYTTFIKFGIGRTTYDAAQEIRSGDIDKDEALMLVKRYDGEFPERFAEEIFQYLSIDEKRMPKAASNFEHPTMDREYFDSLANKFRSPHLWKYIDGQWILSKSIFDAQ